MNNTLNSFSDTYKTIKSPSTGYFMTQRSKFYAFAFPVDSEEEIKQQLAILKKQYFDARHHVFAWILGKDKTRYRINDDGEPSGSSAKPIYGQLLSNDLTNILVVVIRYFGGVKLGVPGLINAYRTAAADALQQAEIVTKMVEDMFVIHFDYQNMNEVMKVIKNENWNIVQQTFDNQCEIWIKIRQSESDRLSKMFENSSSVRVERMNTL